MSVAVNYLVWSLLGTVLLTVAIGGALVLSGRVFTVTVKGRSMEPTLRHGQRVMVLRWPGHRVKRDSIVLMREAGRPDSFFIKRIAAVAGDPTPQECSRLVGRTVPAGQVVLLGDNPEDSVDSRLQGGYAAADIVGLA